MTVPCQHCKTNVHGECLVGWLVRNGTCPVCRTSVMDFGPGDDGEMHNNLLAGMPISFEAVLRGITMSQALWFLVSTTFSVCMPWFFFFTDVVVSFAGFMHLYAGHAMPRAITSCLTGSIFLHILFFVATTLHAIRRETSESRARLQALTVAGIGGLLTVPLFLDHETVSTNSLGNDFLSTNMHVLGVEAAIYLCMTYTLMFVMTIPAMIHPRPVWKVNYLCERIMFVCIISGMKVIGDTRLLLALTSFSGILMSGVILTLE